MAVSFENELLRVMVHGVLHLLDYNDGSVEEECDYEIKEDHYLSLFTDVYRRENYDIIVVGRSCRL